MGLAFASEADRTVPVAIMQISWDFWTVFWIVWTVLVAVALLGGAAAWVIRHYNRGRARADLHGAKDLSKKTAGSGVQVW